MSLCLALPVTAFTLLVECWKELNSHACIAWKTYNTYYLDLYREVKKKNRKKDREVSPNAITPTWGSANVGHAPLRFLWEPPFWNSVWCSVETDGATGTPRGYKGSIIYVIKAFPKSGEKLSSWSEKGLGGKGRSLSEGFAMAEGVPKGEQGMTGSESDSHWGPWGFLSLPRQTPKAGVLRAHVPRLPAPFNLPLPSCRQQIPGLYPTLPFPLEEVKPLSTTVSSWAASSQEDDIKKEDVFWAPAKRWREEWRIELWVSWRVISFALLGSHAPRLFATFLESLVPRKSQARPPAGAARVNSVRGPGESLSFPFPALLFTSPHYL